MNLAGLKPTICRALEQITRTVPQASPRHPPDLPATPHAFRSDLAQAEGWDVFDCGRREDGTPRIEIQRLDSVAPGQPRFRTDGAAWEHVVARALQGSTLHLTALAMLDPTERKMIRLWCPTAARLP